MKPRIYIDTSVFSALLDNRLPERRRLTEAFWERRDEYELAASDLTRQELSQVSEADHREKLLRLLDNVELSPVSEEMERLAESYIEMGCFSVTMFEDALHVAAAVLTRQDILVSWNFKHLVNRRRRTRISATNVELGLPDIEILAPPEV